MAKLSKKEFLKRLGQLTERIRNDVQPFEDTSPAAAEARKTRALNDDLYFAKTYFPHECSDDFAPFHKEMIEAGEVKNRIVAIYGSRGSAKTALPGKIKRIKRTVFRMHRYIAIVGETEEQAIERCAEARAEFENNARLISDFGDLRTLAPWEFGHFKTSNGVTWKAFGWRNKPRGRKAMGQRFDDVWVDDYEDSQTKYNRDIITKKYKKLKEDFLGATNLKDYWFTFIGNYFSTFSVLHELINDPEVSSYKYLIDNTGNCDPAWPARYDRAVLEQLKRTMGSISYQIEIMQQPRDEEEQVVKSHWIREWKAEDWADKPRIKIGFLDPSMRSKEHNDYKAIVCIDVIKEPLRYLTNRVWMRKASVKDVVDMIFRIYQEENLDLMGIEGNNVDEYLEELINLKATALGWRPNLVYIDHTENKEMRLLGFTSQIENGYVLFQSHNSDQKILIEQWKFLFQPGENDDGPDAHEGAVAMAKKYTAKIGYHAVQKKGGGLARMFKGGAW